MDRFIKVKDIPPSLWSTSSQVLSLPKALIDLWKELLKLNNLEDMAIQKAPKGFTGGMSKEDTDKHLAWRYTGSCARVVMTVLDPKNNLSEVALLMLMPKHLLRIKCFWLIYLVGRVPVL